MVNQADKTEDQAKSGSEERTRRPPAEIRDDSALALGKFRALKPLKMTDEELGRDPYNHTGRFSTDD